MAGRLSVEEKGLWEALLAERPELELELEIGKALRAMPPPAVSSNFTSLVMQRLSDRAETNSSNWLSWFRWPRLAAAVGTAVVVLGLSFAAFNQRREHDELAASVKSFTGGLKVVAVREDAQPDAVVRLLQDFDAIRQLPTASNDVDYGLILALGNE
jgi:anti-sigma-K factor RskA